MIVIILMNMIIVIIPRTVTAYPGIMIIMIIMIIMHFIMHGTRQENVGKQGQHRKGCELTIGLTLEGRVRHVVTWDDVC